MTDLDIRPFIDTCPRRTYIADRPIDFATWLELSHRLDSVLVRGVIMERKPETYTHETTFGWLLCLLGCYVGHRKLGKVLGSRSAVKISGNDGRLPDILFVRADNTEIIHKDAIYGTPDLVIEIISENDRPSDLIPLEADYRDIGVPEIVFIDPKKKRVRYLLKSETDYDETYLTTGRLTFVGVPGFWIEVEWLFADEKPDEFTVTKQLIEAAEES
jgi:Uma2 family endonuclease